MGANAKELRVAVELPPKLMPLMEEPRRRYYVAYGGRGAGKSHTFAKALLLQAFREPLRILCVREIQKTISESVHRLLSDQIKILGLEWFYRVQDTTIVGKNGAEFLFAGLRGIDATKLKSYEGVDICWCEEAQAISKKSWDILVPTIRSEGSEIWVSFNPELDSDDAWKRFVVSPQENSWVQKVNWSDNPWFPAVLEQERLHLQKTDLEAYRNVWEGECRTVVEGAIYAREIVEAIEKRRVGPVPYDPSLPVHTIWDLGWNDAMSIILVQKLPSAVMVIGYIEDSFRTYAEYIAQLKDLRYVWGTDWLPHDGASKSPVMGKSAEQVLTALGRRVKIIPRSDVETGIRAARMMFPRVYFDTVGAARLVDCLKRYRRAVPSTTGEPGAPVHDEHSHGADAFRGLAMIVDQITNDDKPKRERHGISYAPRDEVIGI